MPCWCGPDGSLHAGSVCRRDLVHCAWCIFRLASIRKWDIAAWLRFQTTGVFSCLIVPRKPAVTLFNSDLPDSIRGACVFRFRMVRQRQSGAHYLSSFILFIISVIYLSQRRVTGSTAVLGHPMLASSHADHPMLATRERADCRCEERCSAWPICDCRNDRILAHRERAGKGRAAGGCKGG